MNRKILFGAAVVAIVVSAVCVQLMFSSPRVSSATLSGVYHTGHTASNNSMAGTTALSHATGTTHRRGALNTSPSVGDKKAITAGANASTKRTTNGAVTTLSGEELPPGVTYDPSVQPLVPLTDSYKQKFQAVLQVAESKLGTQYIWGHNEDRGQYGFDCSNFVAYVYHHALGYKMSGASQVQYHSVGTSVPVADLQPGDLVIFDHGAHVGIYVGNERMIQEGGGLHEVGFLRLSPGSYWYKHISAVRQMF